MAKSKSFFGLRRGSTKTMTFSTLKGQQVTKDRVTDVANPKTQSQMIQRMVFANAVKFFKHGQKAFFKFAFEDKKTTESDYNAFMRHNVKNTVAVSYPNYKEDAYPAFGNYQLTQGSLVYPRVYWSQDNKRFLLPIAEFDVVEGTIGEISTAILGYYPSLVKGDIVTILIVHTSLKADGSMTNDKVNRWDIRQFVIDPDDNRDSLDTIGVINNEEGLAVIKHVEGQDFDETVAKGAAVIFSRNTPNGLKVSTSHIVGNGVAKQYIAQMSTPQAMKSMAITWGSADKAILQGALAE